MAAVVSVPECAKQEMSNKFISAEDLKSSLKL